MKRSFFVLAYDIRSDRRRNKIAKAMEAVATRVQASVFEAYLTTSELEAVVKKAKKVIHPAEDTLRVYQLCAACAEKVTMIGYGEKTGQPDVVIV